MDLPARDSFQMLEARRMPRLWYVVLIFLYCKTRGTRTGPKTGTNMAEEDQIGNTSHLPANQTGRFIRAARSQARSSTNRALYASLTASFSDAAFNTYIQTLLSGVITDLLPMDITKALPRTIKDVSNLLKGREESDLIGSLKDDADKSEVFKVIQTVKRLAIAKILILPPSMKFLSNDKIDFSLPIEIVIDGKSSKSGIFSSLEKVNLDIQTKLLWDPSKDQIFIIEVALIDISDIQVKMKKSTPGPAEKNIQSVLWTILNSVISQCTRLVADVLNSSISSALTSTVPAGKFGNIQYNPMVSPKVTDRFLMIYLQATFRAPLSGGPASATPLQWHPPPDSNIQLVLSKDFISYAITAVTGGSRAELSNGAGKQLTTTDLTSVIPKISEHFSVPKPLVVKIKGSNTPVVSMDNQNATMKQDLFMDAFASGQSVLHVEVTITFNLKLSVSNGKLFIFLSQNSFDIVQTSSSFGSTNPSKVSKRRQLASLRPPSEFTTEAQKLHDWVNGIYVSSYLPAMNDMLSRGIALPTMLSIKWIKVNTALSKDGLVVSM